MREAAAAATTTTHTHIFAGLIVRLPCHNFISPPRTVLSAWMFYCVCVCVFALEYLREFFIDISYAGGNDKNANS